MAPEPETTTDVPPVDPVEAESPNGASIGSIAQLAAAGARAAGERATGELPVDPSLAGEPSPEQPVDGQDPPQRRSRRILALVAVGAILAAIVGLAFRTPGNTTGFVEAGVLEDLAYTEPPGTTTTTPTTEPEPEPEPAPLETTATVAPETTTTPTTAVPGPAYQRPPRPRVNLAGLTSKVAYPKATGTVWLTGGAGSTAGVISFPNPRQIGDNPNATVPLVFLVKQDLGAWLEVYVPARPNMSTYWIQRADVDIVTHNYRVEVYLQEFNIKVYDGTNLLLDDRIGVAKASTPTPIGIFYTSELVRPTNPSGPYGPYAFGLNGFSDVLLSFGGGPGQLGMHGTNQPGLIGREVSSGCIRLSNANITYLAGFLPQGTPIVVNDRF